MLGAERVIAIDRFRERLDLAAADGKTEVLDYGDLDDVFDQLKEMTGGRGPDRCIDAVGMEAHGTFVDAVVDTIKQAVKLQFDRAHALRQALHCCRKGGTVSIPGVYAGFIDKVPFGTAFGKGLTLKMGQTHVHSYTEKLLGMIESGKIDPSFIITHRVSLDDAPEMYRTFRAKQDNCIKVVMRPS
jgi:threonine dehydrogenase-like Zn-dependent dehydrogenase